MADITLRLTTYDTTVSQVVWQQQYRMREALAILANFFTFVPVRACWGVLPASKKCFFLDSPRQKWGGEGGVPLSRQWSGRLVVPIMQHCHQYLFGVLLVILMRMLYYCNH